MSPSAPPPFVKASGIGEQHRAVAPVVEDPVVVDAGVVHPRVQDPGPDRHPDERLDGRVRDEEVEVVGVDVVVVDLGAVGGEAGMAGRRERVARDPGGVAVDVVVGDPHGVAHRARVAERRAVQVAVLDDGVRARRVGVEVGRLRAGLGRGARVDGGVAGAEALAVLDHVVVGGEAQVAVVGRPEELDLVEQDAVDLLVVEAVLPRPAQEEVAPDEAVGAVHAQDDVLGVAAGLRRRAPRPGSPCPRRGSRPRAWDRCPRSAGCSARTGRAPGPGSPGGWSAAARAACRSPRGPGRRSGSGRWGR